MSSTISYCEEETGEYNYCEEQEGNREDQDDEAYYNEKYCNDYRSCDDENEEAEEAEEVFEYHISKNKKQIVQKNDKETDISLGLYRPTFKNNNHIKQTDIFYTSRYTPGSSIRNAVSGRYEYARVGSNRQDMFFKVAISTGEMGKNPYGNHLYFDSPEQYEKYFGVSVNDSLKSAWRTKCNKFIHEYEDENLSEQEIIEMH
jgi:hypothetical protein